MQIKFPTEEEVVADEAFIQKVLRNKFSVFGGIVFFLALALAVSGGGSKRMKRERDFFSLSHSQALLKKGSEDFNESKLLKLLKEHPEAEGDFSYLLRDDKVVEGKLEEAGLYEEGIISRLSYIHPYYLEFMRVAHLMEEGEQNTTFEALGQLKSKIEKEGIDQFPRLYSFVLSRYCYLLEQKGQREEKTVIQQLLTDLLNKENSSLGRKGQEDLQKYVGKDPLFAKVFN